MNRTVIILRKARPKLPTIGILSVVNSEMNVLFSCVSMERPWEGNLPNISCIPVNTYDLVYEKSDKFGMMLWEVKGVVGRSEIKIHPLNLVSESLGCIGVGSRVEYGGPNGTRILNSRATLKQFHLAMAGGSTRPGPAKLIIKYQ